MRIVLIVLGLNMLVGTLAWLFGLALPFVTLSSTDSPGRVMFVLMVWTSPFVPAAIVAGILGAIALRGTRREVAWFGLVLTLIVLQTATPYLVVNKSWPARAGIAVSVVLAGGLSTAAFAVSRARLQRGILSAEA